MTLPHDRRRPALIRLGPGSYQRDVAPGRLRQPLDLLFLLAFAAGVLVGWLLTR